MNNWSESISKSAKSKCANSITLTRSKSIGTKEGDDGDKESCTLHGFSTLLFVSSWSSDDAASVDLQ